MPPKAKRIDSELESLPKAKAAFIEPMLLLRTGALPEAANWLYELKLDGYRALAINSAGRVQLRSRNDNDFSVRYPAIIKALASLPSETVIDGEVVALDESGRPSFNILQNYGSSKGPILYYVFDVLVLAGWDVMGMPLRVPLRSLPYKHIGHDVFCAKAIFYWCSSDLRYHRYGRKSNFATESTEGGRACVLPMRTPPMRPSIRANCSAISSSTLTVPLAVNVFQRYSRINEMQACC
jgi:hypothetical protein